MEPHRLQFLHTQGPVARIEWRKGTQILRAGRILPAPRGNPRNGVRGKATMSTKCSSGAVPGGVLVPLPPWAKELAARRRRNSLCIINPFRNLPLIRPLRGHLSLYPSVATRHHPYPFWPTAISPDRGISLDKGVGPQGKAFKERPSSASLSLGTLPGKERQKEAEAVSQ